MNKVSIKRIYNLRLQPGVSRKVSSQGRLRPSEVSSSEPKLRVLSSSASLERILKQYARQVQSIVSKIEDSPEGLSEGISYKRFFRSGKHQPVSGIELTFPGRQKIKIVARSTSPDFPILNESHTVVKEAYPTIHGSFKDSRGKDILILEYLTGYDSKRGSESFERLMLQDHYHEKIIADLFPIINEIYQQPLELVDVHPPVGHNVIFNLKTRKFQLFDIDTIQHSSQSQEAKWLNLIDSMTNGRTNNAITQKFLFNFLKRLLKEYPTLPFEEREAQRSVITRSEPVFDLESLGKNEPNIAWPGTELHTVLIRNHQFGPHRAKLASNPPIRYHRENLISGRRISQDLLNAVKENDLNLFQELMSKRRSAVEELRIKVE